MSKASGKSQTQRVLERLAIGPITAMQAITELGVMRLSARIEELRDQAINIKTEMVAVPSRVDGETARVARYSMIKPEGTQ